MAIPTLEPVEVKSRIRFAHANDLHAVTMSFWTLSGPGYSPVNTWLNTVNYTPDKIYQIQSIDYNVSEGVGSVAFLGLGFSNIPAAWGNPGQGMAVFIKPFISNDQGTINFNPSGLYLPVGKTISTMSYHTVLGQHIVGSVTLYLLETFET